MLHARTFERQSKRSTNRTNACKVIDSFSNSSNSLIFDTGPTEAFVLLYPVTYCDSTRSRFTRYITGLVVSGVVSNSTSLAFNEEFSVMKMRDINAVPLALQKLVLSGGPSGFKITWRMERVMDALLSKTGMKADNESSSFCQKRYCFNRHVGMSPVITRE